MNRILAIARRDFRRTLRDRVVWGAVALLGVMLLPSTATVASSEHLDIGEVLLLIPLDLLTFALVVVAAVGYSSVVGERASGTVRVVLGLGGTRRDLVYGKFIARAAVVAIALTVVLAVASILVAGAYGTTSLVPFWVMAGWMVLYGVVWTAVTVGYSAAFASQYRTLAALVATYGVFSPVTDVWSAVVRPVFALAFTGSIVTPTYEAFNSAPLWFRVTERLNPLNAFFRAVSWSVSIAGSGTPSGTVWLHGFGTLVFLGFGALGLGLGLRRFERLDLCEETGGSAWRASLVRLHPGRIAPTPGVRAHLASSERAARTLTLVRSDIRHAFQHWVVVGAVSLFALLVAPQLWTNIYPNGIGTASDVFVRITYVFTLPLLVLGVAVGYDAVVGERESGTIRLVLGSAGRRREVLVAKVLARLFVLAVALAPLLLFTEGLLFARFGSLFPAAFLAWAGWLLVAGVAWTAFVVGASAALASRYRVLAAVFGTYLFFGPDVGLWGAVVRPLVSLLFTGRFSTFESHVHGAAQAPAWFSYTDHLNPFVALDTIRDGLFVAAGHGTEFTHAPAPLFAFSLVVLFAFVTSSLLVGFRRFSHADLG